MGALAKTDVVVIGAGVMGLMAARELSAGGCQVTVLERGEAAQEASWAGGGIVSPLYPWRYNKAVTALSSWSQGRYVPLARELERQTGISPELRQKGLLMLAVDDQDVALQWAFQNDRPLSQIDAEAISELEPHISINHASGMWMPEVSSIRNPRLGQALVRSIELDPNITIVSRAQVECFDLHDGRVQAVETSAGRFEAEKFLVCAGAWSGDLLWLLGRKLAVEPVKGQMMLFNAEKLQLAGLRGSEAVPILDRVVLTDGRYLIPRNDGRILVGSTLEYQGYDKQVTETAYQSLYQSAVDILPALAQCPVEAQWAGLRPGSVDGVPYIGAVEGLDNLYLNAGHFRNGLVLAPASCRLVADLMLDRPAVIDPTPYRWSLQP